MEHSLLHAVQLFGVVATLGGAFVVLALLEPAACVVAPDRACDMLRSAFVQSVRRWVFVGALAGACAALLDVLVQVAEMEGQTVLGGIDSAFAFRFATRTTVGRLLLARAAALLLAAVVVRIARRATWLLVAALGIAAAVCTALVSHAAAQPSGHALNVTGQLTHIIAAALWLGVLGHLLAARTRMQAAPPASIRLVAEIVRRFSPIAFTAVVLLAASGLVTACRFVGTPGAIFTSTYGVTLALKLTLLVPLFIAAFMNFRVIRPALLAAAGRPALDVRASAALRRFGCMLELELTAGVLVIAVAGILGSIAPPAGDAALRLTSTQVRALLSPDLPTTAIVNPAVLYDLPERTADDLRYSEFTHNWSGMFVTALGLCWLVQASGGRLSRAAGHVWPLLLVAFASFVAAVADPEVWVFRRLTLWQALSDPRIAEHHVGASLVLVLAWLGWRDRRTSAPHRPLGYALAVVMIFGSLLLLGHAHASQTITDDLSNLITVQHAILGALGLYAGTVRWLSMRGLFPARAARVVGPSLVIAFGLFLVFCYRELV